MTPTTSPEELPDKPIEQWLSLTDYSAKFRVSVSTLRRRIKNNQIAHRFVDGKYLLLDSRPAELEHSYHQQAPLDSMLNPSSAAEFLRGLGFEKSQSAFAAESAPIHDEAQSKLDQLRDIQNITEQTAAPSTHSPELSSQGLPELEMTTAEPIILSATRLLNELKRAYMNILHEKEEQIIQLKEEVSDLRTLVHVPEDDNARMRRSLGLERIPNS